MPSLSSFINSSQYSTENITVPFFGAMLAGSSYNNGLTFNGVSGAAGNDPGGLFGWLIYSRAVKANPTKGYTSDQYILYKTPQDLVNDLNALDGVTACLVSATGASEGGTYGLFATNGIDSNNNVKISPRPAGIDFLHALEYMAYGGSLVISGTTNGLTKYTTDTNNYFDVLIGQTATNDNCRWLIRQPFTVGVFPTAVDSSGVLGNSYSILNFTSLFGGSTYVTGNTVANRVFNVYGINSFTGLDTSTLYPVSKITYSQSCVSDVAGFFARAKNRNSQYLTVAGSQLGTVLNGAVTNPIEWSSTDKDTLRTNRANFFVNYNPKFLGSDLIGATSNSVIGSYDRIGPAKMYVQIYQILYTTGLKYLYQINNAATRSAVSSAVTTAMEPLSPYIDTTQTQIICDSSNNTDNSTTLKISVVVKPIVSTSSFGIDITLTQ